MPFTIAEKQNIKEVVGGFCQEKSLGCQSNQPKVIYRIRGYDVTLFHVTPSLVKNHKRVEIPFAKLRFDPKNSEWTLFFLQDKGQWVQYPTSCIFATLKQQWVRSETTLCIYSRDSPPAGFPPTSQIQSSPHRSLL